MKVMLDTNVILQIVIDESELKIKRQHKFVIEEYNIIKR